ncbi:acyl-CoA thioesterase [Tepidicaulis sp. LMO-SS28]|uniref:acyl-CoA thioesterase n=1 Tax=Tepidicaulis sp. LMO-SS28 TaxID=3447455 RepID=UPI003EE30FCC
MTAAEPRDGWDYPSPFIVDLTVKDEHIDDFQHTNNVVYLTWMAKTAWDHSKALGLDFAAYRKLGKGMVVRRHEMEYFAPSFAGEKLRMATWITGNDGRLRLRRRFQMVNEAGVTLLRGLSDFVCINIESGKATRMPKEFVETYALTADEPGDR